jgi:formylglycine-generating enzyme required for sulfatase activity
MARVEKTVFLSYRRANTPWALSIYQDLTANGFDVFFDYKGIASGDFESVILENIRARAHFLVALTPSALERCADHGDWLRREIEEAIECRRNIVPMLLEGFDFGASAVASQLTGRLAELKKYNGLTLPIEYFDAAMERLREKFLNVPVDTVLHRVSAFAREAAMDQQAAVGLVSMESEKPKNGSDPVATPIHPIPELGGKPGEELLPRLPKKITNSIGMEFVLIPAGSFVMGSRISPEELVQRYGGEKKECGLEKPHHPVKIEQPFYLQTTPVTHGQWQRLTGDNPSSFKDCGDDCPVEQASWIDVQMFIEELNRIEEIKDYRLASEAEWEYSCRAGSETEFFFGSFAKRLGEFAWYSENSDAKTHPVGKKKPNAWGLYDMYGNVWEWVEDDWHGSYDGAPVDGRAWVYNPRGSGRVVRGGSWSYEARYCRSATRNYYWPGYRPVLDVGFRLSRSVALGL